ncbi:MAG: ferrous iron transport protein A [Pirellula sp.]|jgi:ferrous iron transport protein A|nr:ferrous iron transport protein A [Pirellula sp.]
MPTDSSTLCGLQSGERGQILSVEGSDAVAARLLEMGILPGEEIEMIGAAPMGDPIEFSVYGYRISLRRSEAARVRIEKQP